MKIAFFGQYGTFDYFRIGGTESYARRLSAGLIAQGHQVDFVSYRAPAAKACMIPEGPGLHYFSRLAEAFDFLGRYCDHVVNFYVLPHDRLRFLLFRRRNHRHIRFHQFFFNFADSPLRRLLAVADARLYPYNGRLFCVSPRQYRAVRRWSKRAMLLLPPVPEDFFLDPGAKTAGQAVCLTYIGRTEPGKGIEEVINLFQYFQGLPGIRLKLYGYHHPHCQASVSIHHWLSRQEALGYHYTPYESHDPQVDSHLRQILKDTDILLLPYLRSISTIDAPVLLLEGMAYLCATIAPVQGSIPDIYGASAFLYGDAREMPRRILHAAADPAMLETEKQRLFRRNQELGFHTGTVTRRFLEALA